MLGCDYAVIAVGLVADGISCALCFCEIRFCARFSGL